MYNLLHSQKIQDEKEKNNKHEKTNEKLVH